MAKEKKQAGGKPDKSAAEYYQLKTDAVNQLVNANVTNTEEIPEKELKKYRRKSLLNMPEGLKYFLLKAWFAGVICWFFLIGLGSYGIASLDMIVIMGIVTGLIWDLPVNIYIRLKAEEKDYGRWMMFPKTGVGAGICNALYGLVLVGLVAGTYAVINRILYAAGSEQALSVGPILFGLLTAGWDWILLRFKTLGRNILSDAREKAGSGR